MSKFAVPNQMNFCYKLAPCLSRTCSSFYCVPCACFSNVSNCVSRCSSYSCNPCSRPSTPHQAEPKQPKFSATDFGAAPSIGDNKKTFGTVGKGKGTSGGKGKDKGGKNRKSVDSSGNRKSVDSSGNRKSVDSSGNRKSVDSKGNRKSVDNKDGVNSKKSKKNGKNKDKKDGKKKKRSSSDSDGTKNDSAGDKEDSNSNKKEDANIGDNQKGSTAKEGGDAGQKSSTAKEGDNANNGGSPLNIKDPNNKQLAEIGICTPKIPTFCPNPYCPSNLRKLRNQPQRCCKCGKKKRPHCPKKPQKGHKCNGKIVTVKTKNDTALSYHAGDFLESK